MKPTSLIPNFLLYGESTHPTQPEFVHIEDIAARSRQHDWIIKPHRHGRMFQLLCLYNGRMNVMLDDEYHEMEGNWVISIPPGSVHGFNFPTDTQGVVLTFVDSLFDSDAQQQLSPYFNELLRQPMRTRFESDSPLLAQLKQQFDRVSLELAQMGAGHELMLRWIVKSLLMILKRQIDFCEQQTNDPISKSKQPFMEFRKLLEQNYRQHWAVSDYAEALHTSPSTLNRICKQQSGITAKANIQNRLLLEIKRRLIYTASSNENIAYTLGFKDPSYFSRFFKKQESLSPLEYRQMKYAETGTSTQHPRR